jgi:flagellar FliL protein
LSEEHIVSDEPEKKNEAPTPKRGGMMKFAIPIVMLLAAGGGGAWWFVSGRSTKVVAAEPDPSSRGLVTFEPFLVNLADSGGNRFLKVTVELVVESEAKAKEIQDTPVVLMQVRSAVLELLTQQSAAELVTADGKTTLKKNIKERVSALLPKQKVIDVLFSEFVVQF